MAATAQRLLVKEYASVERIDGSVARRLEKRIERIDPLDTKAGLYVASVSLLLTSVLPADSFAQGLSTATAVGTAASLICLSAAVSAYAAGRNPHKRKVRSVRVDARNQEARRTAKSLYIKVAAVSLRVAVPALMAANLLGW